MASQWAPPLPPGFEARWDPNQRAYFFIDHSNKTTSWQDPRFPAQVPAPVTHQAAAQGAGTRPTGGATGGQDIPLFLKCRQFGGTTTIESSESSSDEQDQDIDNLFTSCAEKPSQDSEFQKKVKEIQAEFPTATESEIVELLKSNDNLTMKVKNKLYERGYELKKKVDSKPFVPEKVEQEKVDLLKLHQLKQSFPLAPEDVIQQLLKMHHNNFLRVSSNLRTMGYRWGAVSHPEPKRVDILERLNAMYPDAGPEVTEPLFESCHGDEKTMRKVLEDLGFKPKFPETHRNPSAKGPTATSTAPEKSSANSASRGTTLKRSVSPSRVASPAKPALSEGQKSQLVSQLHSVHKDMEKSVIEMALQVCDWDETRVKNVLDRMKDDTRSRPGTSASRPSTSGTQRSPSPVLSPASLEPVSLFDEEPRPGTSASSASKSSAHSYMKGSDFPSRSSTAMGSKINVHKSSSPMPGKLTGSQTKSHVPKSSSSQQTRMKFDDAATSSTHHTRAKQVTHHGLQDPVVSQQPQRPVYVSVNRTEAKGPDPSLCVGPNKGLLLTNYTKANGPNPELRQGPDPGRVQGSRGAVGPDRSLSCGPQHALVKGPNTDLRQVAYV